MKYTNQLVDENIKYDSFLHIWALSWENTHFGFQSGLTQIYQATQPQKRARVYKFPIQEAEELYSPCSKN